MAFDPPRAFSRAREIRDAQLWDRQRYSGRKAGDLCEIVNHEFLIRESKVDGNSETSGGLPAPRQFLIEGFSAVPSPDVGFNDLSALIESTLFTLTIGDRRYFQFSGHTVVPLYIQAAIRSFGKWDDKRIAEVWSRPLGPAHLIEPRLVIPQRCCYRIQAELYAELLEPANVTVFLFGKETRAVM